jgi:penicillin-binding protein 2
MLLSRRKFLMLALGGIGVILDACSNSSPTAVAPTIVPTPNATPPVPPQTVARAFLDVWSNSDYAAMYQWLAPRERARIGQDDFVKFYQTTGAEATNTAARLTFISALEDADTATVQFKVNFETVLFGAIEEDNALALVLESNRWGILWSPGNFLKDLADDNRLKFYPTKSTRGNIYDRNGQPLAVGQTVIVVNLWPAEMRRNQVEAKVLAGLEPILNLSQFDIQRKYANANPEWKMPIATISADAARANADVLSLPGVVTEEQDARAYPQGTIAAHVAGYVGQISAEELSQVYGQGYREGENLGRAGLERAAEKYLARGRGGRLVVISPSGEEVATLKERAAQQSQSIYSTIDLDLQTFVDGLLGNRRGNIIVMDVKTGSLLAMVSHPAYDPNAFMDSTRQHERQSILTSPQKPLLNRATQGAYPQGSVQKIITTAAALERGRMTPNTTFVDTGVWNGLGYPKICWIWAYGRTHGVVTLQKALTVSCDIAFYQIGLRLDKLDQDLMPSFSYAFGLGSETGIGVEESAGNVPDPKKQQPWFPTDPVDMAIGQDTFLVSPLQVLDFVAAVANGGTLWKPRLIAKIQDLASGTEQSVPSEKRGALPVSASTLRVIHDALKGVTTDKDGTATFVFQGLPMVVAGKTGTAQVPGKNEPHAWFAGYAPADNPEIGCVVMIENGGEGSMVAAPLFRQVIERYFNLKPTVPKTLQTPSPQPSE